MKHNDLVILDKKNNFQKWWLSQKKKSLLRFLTCGSVDDGKSTLIGRLLYDSKEVYSDQLSSLYKDSKIFGNKEKIIDLSLLVDGLESEREQGITIDIAYRYFSTSKKKFIIADSPGHKQYTRNMATGASNSDVSVLLIDAVKGLTNQTYRHSLISSLLGIKYFIVAINKMDLVHYKENIFNNIKKKFFNFSKKLPIFPKIYFIPICALLGDNVVKNSSSMSWYKGKTLINTLEDINILSEYNKSDTIFPVQYVNRLQSNYRGYCGTLFSGKLYVGQKIKVLPSFSSSTISKIITFKNELQMVDKPLPLTIVLADDIDLSRGDVLVNDTSYLKPATKALLYVIWMFEHPLIVGQRYKIKVASKTTNVIIENIVHELNSDTLKENKANQLSLNSIGLVNVIFEEPIIINEYRVNSNLGGIIFIDFLTNMTVGAGMVKSYDSGVKLKPKNNLKSFILELNKLICKFFPDWNIKNINKL